MKERKHRIEDAISATKAAVEEGTVPGGGAALTQLVQELDGGLGLSGEEAVGVSIVRKALDEPLRWIAENAGEDGYVVVEKVRGMSWGTGLDAAVGGFVDLAGAGIIDPVKVTRNAVTNAASIAGLLLTTESLVVEKPARAEPAEGGGMRVHVGERSFLVMREPGGLRIDGRLHQVRVAAVARSGAAAAAGAAVAKVRAPMNGKLDRVLVAPGDAVRRGDVLFVLEAMKMHNEVRSPVAGRVAAVHLAAGAVVGPGEPVLEVASE